MASKGEPMTEQESAADPEETIRFIERELPGVKAEVRR